MLMMMRKGIVMAPVAVLLRLVLVMMTHIVIAATAAVAVATASTRRVQKRKVHRAAALWVQIEKIGTT